METLETPMFEDSTGRNWTVVSLSTLTFTLCRHVVVVVVDADVAVVVVVIADAVVDDVIVSIPMPM
jgi:hypothetical protein